LRFATLLTTAGLMLLGRSAFAQEVTYDYDRATDFSTIRTYAWAGGTNLNEDLNHARIVAAIDSQLAARGMAKVTGDVRPDVYIVYRVGFAEDVSIVGSGWGRYAYRTTGSARAEKVTVGTLAVGIVSAESGAIIWRASATKDVDRKASPEKREKSINKAVEKLFKHYPAKV
jgi:hypothetical protein